MREWADRKLDEILDKILETMYDPTISKWRRKKKIEKLKEQLQYYYEIREGQRHPVCPKLKGKTLISRGYVYAVVQPIMYNKETMRFEKIDDEPTRRVRLSRNTKICCNSIIKLITADNDEHLIENIPDSTIRDCLTRNVDWARYKPTAKQPKYRYLTPDEVFKKLLKEKGYAEVV